MRVVFFPLVMAALWLAVPSAPVRSARPPAPLAAQNRLASVEASSGGRLGLAALDTGDGTRIEYRAGERFPLCSTFKVLAVSAVLERSAAEPELLQRSIAYSQADLVSYSPVTEKRSGAGMTVAELCAAALQYSDNTAANLLIRLLGGPEQVTAFARRIDDPEFRLDRWETELNSALPEDPRDTSTPGAMRDSLEKLLLGDGLPAARRDMLVAWMRSNTTGAARIAAGLPSGWEVADKTGTGDYGTTNDVAVIYPPGRDPIVLAIYFTQPDAAAPARNDVIAVAARVVADALGP